MFSNAASPSHGAHRHVVRLVMGIYGEEGESMSSSHMPASQYAHEAERAARGAANSPMITWLARFGYAAKGIVYLIIGGLAGAAAIGQRER